jgi:hypothetical protein
MSPDRTSPLEVSGHRVALTNMVLVSGFHGELGGVVGDKISPNHPEAY